MALSMREMEDRNQLYANSNREVNTLTVFVEKILIFVSDEYEQNKILPNYDSRYPRTEHFNENFKQAICNLINHYPNIINPFLEVVCQRILTEADLKRFVDRMEVELLGSCTAQNVFLFLSIVSRVTSRLYAKGMKEFHEYAIDALVRKLLSVNERFEELGGWAAMETAARLLTGTPENMAVVAPLRNDVFAYYMQGNNN